MTRAEIIYHMVDEYEIGGATAGEAYAMTAAYFDLSYREVVDACNVVATAILQAQRDRGER